LHEVFGSENSRRNNLSVAKTRAALPASGEDSMTLPAGRLGKQVRVTSTRCSDGSLHAQVVAAAASRYDTYALGQSTHALEASVSFDSLAQHLESPPAKQARQEYLPFTLQACENFGEAPQQPLMQCIACDKPQDKYRHTCHQGNEPVCNPASEAVRAASEDRMLLPVIYAMSS
jgi:hypothetical protein